MFTFIHFRAASSVSLFIVLIVFFYKFGNNSYGGDCMKKYNLMGIVIEDRNEFAPQVQDVLTEFGSIIKTRIGLHDGSENYISNEGFIILSLEDDDRKIDEFSKKLKEIKTVRVKNIKV